MTFMFPSIRHQIFYWIWMCAVLYLAAHAVADDSLVTSSFSYSQESSDILPSLPIKATNNEVEDVSNLEMHEGRSQIPSSSDIYSILFITSSDQRGTYDALLQGFNNVITADPNVKYMVEHIDRVEMQTNPDEYLPMLHRLFNSRYTTNPDLIVVSGDSAYQFMIQYHDTLFPSVPLLFNTLSVPDTRAFSDISGLVTGYSRFPTIAQTIGVTQQINPKLSKIYVLTPNSAEGHQFAEEVMQIASRDSSIEYIIAPYNQTLQEVITSIQGLGPNAALLLDDYHFIAESGNRYSIKEVLPDIVEQISVPIYTVTNRYNGDGVLGGYQIDLFALGEKMGNLAISLLSNDFSSTAPIGMELGTPVFNYERMQALSIPESTLPPGSVFVDKPESTTELSPEMLIAIALLGITLLASIIILLFWGEKLRHANQDVVRQQNIQEDVVSQLAFGFYARDVQHGMKYVLFNPKMEELTGEKVSDVLGRTAQVPGTPGDQEELCIKTKSVVTSEMLLTHTEEMRILYYIIHPTIKNNEVVLIRGHVLDITERRMWELKLYESLELFQSFFEKNLYAIAIYSPVRDENGMFSDLRFVDVNPGFETLFNLSRSDILGKTERDVFSTYGDEYYDRSLRKVISSIAQKRALPFENSRRGDVYISGYFFGFGENDEYIGFTCVDTTRIAKLREEDATLFEQIQNNIDEITHIREDIVAAARHIRELMLNEKDAAFGTMVIEQTYIIEDLLLQIDQGLVQSDKIQEFLRKHHGVIENRKI